MEDAKEKKSVKVYTTPACPWCFKAKDFLKDNGVEFQEVNVAEDHDAAREMVEKSGQTGVPVIEIGKEIIVGFDAERIRKALGLE